MCGIFFKGGDSEENWKFSSSENSISYVSKPSWIGTKFRPFLMKVFFHQNPISSEIFLLNSCCNIKSWEWIYCFHLYIHTPSFNLCQKLRIYLLRLHHEKTQNYYFLRSSPLHFLSDANKFFDRMMKRERIIIKKKCFPSSSS